jgi:hypothetical protein
VIDGVTGTFFEEQTSDHLMNAIEAFENQSFSPQALRLHAEKFNIEVFRAKIESFLMRIGAPVALPSPGLMSIVSGGN